MRYIPMIAEFAAACGLIGFLVRNGIERSLLVVSVFFYASAHSYAKLRRSVAVSFIVASQEWARRFNEGMESEAIGIASGIAGRQ